MKKKIAALIMICCLAFSATGCSSCERAKTDILSDINGGLDRTITIYTANGDVIAEYKGKIDIEANDGGYVKFDYKSKRYIYYNCFVESIANID